MQGAELRERIRSASRLIFHRNSHLDDAATQWFLREVAGVVCPFEFQTNGEICIDAGRGELGLDVMHEHAVKGEKQSDGGFSSVFACVVRAFLFEGSTEMQGIAPLLAWVDTNDSKGSVTKAWLGKEHEDIEAVGLNQQFLAFKDLYGHNGDEVTNHKFGTAVLEPLYRFHCGLALARQTVMESCEFYIDSGIGVCIGHVPGKLMGWPQKVLQTMADREHQEPIRLFVYVDPKSGMGVLRIDERLRLDNPGFQSEIRQKSGQWFFHPGGFLAAYGTATSVRDPRHSGWSVSDLVLALKRSVL